MFVKLGKYRVNTDKITDYYYLNKFLYINLVSGMEIELSDPREELVKRLDSIVLRD